MQKPRSHQNGRQRTEKRRLRLYMLAEASNPWFKISGIEILIFLVLVLIVVSVF